VDIRIVAARAVGETGEVRFEVDFKAATAGRLIRKTTTYGATGVLALLLQRWIEQFGLDVVQLG
jgi:hypothetical protein